MTMFDQIEYKGYTIRILPDPDLQNPRTEFDYLGRMICFSNKYRLGDEHSYYDAEEVSWGKSDVALSLFHNEYNGRMWSDEPSASDLESGSFVGYIIATAEDIKKESGHKIVTKQDREWAAKRLRAEVEEYSAYLEGNAYGFEIVNEAKEVVDSCWGFYDYDCCLEAAKEAVDELPPLNDFEEIE